MRLAVMRIPQCGLSIMALETEPIFDFRLQFESQPESPLSDKEVFRMEEERALQE